MNRIEDYNKESGFMKRKKGFTLVELIVAIAIIGIILILALPRIGKIKSDNSKREYEVYEDSIESAAKLYVDSHGKDLFGNNESGCITIRYSQLKESNLIKDFSSKDITCSNDNETYVEVRKINDNYKYDTAITCKDTKKVVYQKTINHTNDNCENIPDKQAPTIEAIPDSHNWVQSKNLKVTIKVSDSSGLKENIGVIYYWTNATGIKISEDYQYNYKNKKNIETVSFVIPTENIPTETGEYNLVVQPWYSSSTDGVQDVLGNEKIGAEEFGPYKIDNTPPSCPNLSTTTPEKTWTNKDITFTFDFTEDTSKWEWYTDSNGDWKFWWEKSSTETTEKISGEGKRKIKVKVYDAAGNSKECFSDQSYWIDKTAPKVSEWLKIENLTCGSHTAKYGIRPVVIDNLSGYVGGGWKWTGGSQWPLELPSPKMQRKECIASSIAYNKQKITYKLCDAAGNCTKELTKNGV